MKIFEIKVYCLPTDNFDHNVKGLEPDIIDLDKMLDDYISKIKTKAKIKLEMMLKEEISFKGLKDHPDFILSLLLNIGSVLLFPNEELKTKLKTIGFDDEQFKWFVSMEELKKILHKLTHPNREYTFFNFINSVAIVPMIELHLNFKFLNSILMKYDCLSTKKGNQKTKYNYLSEHIIATRHVKPIGERIKSPQSEKSKEKVFERLIYDTAIKLIQNIDEQNAFAFDLLEISQGKTEKIFLFPMLEEFTYQLVSTNPEIKKISKSEFILRLAPLISLICPDLLITREEYEDEFVGFNNIQHSADNRQPYDSYERYVYNTIISKLKSQKKK